MSLKTPEEKKQALTWVIQQLKIFGVSASIALGGVWAVAQIYLEDYVEDKVNSILAEKGTSKSFREILGEQLNIPTDMVPYHITDKINQFDSLKVEIQDFENKYIPYLEFQIGIYPIYRYIDQNGIEWWMGPDGRSHGVLFDDGHAWCVYSNRKVIIGNAY